MAKNIILLSDGTGNSASKLLKTNVWRLYESLDLRDPTAQVACYDDGVGTSSFKPLAILGGAMGVGLKRNVLRLYRFLCEHYDPGDRIYLFGFSRGAFTVRVLAGLVLTRGIIKTRPTYPTSEATAEGATLPPTPDPDDPNQLPYGKELSRVAKWEYRRYRAAKFSNKALLAVAARPLRDLFLGIWQALGLRLRLSRGARATLRQQQQDILRNSGPHPSSWRIVRGFYGWLAKRLWWHISRGNLTVKHRPASGNAPTPTPSDYTAGKYADSLGPGVRIQFMGVWDTVDAYGLPVDELTAGIDRWIWPLSFRDQTLDTRVVKACHALALNDERATFHPVLWDESDAGDEPKSAAHQRITQVWFAGMHANVGGGYPDDALSAVSFNWMTRQITPALCMVPNLLRHYARRADLLGRIYDSRSGLRAYYRYNPRRIEHLYKEAGRNPAAQVTIKYPKIHESVFQRIAAAPEAYAPIGLPASYDIVKDDGVVTRVSRSYQAAGYDYETPDAAEKRAGAQDRVWPFVWARRGSYFANVIVTVILLSLPFVGDIADRAMVTAEASWASRLVSNVLGFLPAYVAPVSAYYTAAPMWFFILVGLLGILSLASNRLQRHISYKMRGIWLKVIPPYLLLYRDLDDRPGMVRKFNRSRWMTTGARWALKVVPVLFAAAVVLASMFGIYSIYVAAADPMEQFCTPTRMPLPALALGKSSGSLQFSSKSPCTGTGLKLERGKHYHLQIDLSTGGTWSDDGIPVTEPHGIAFTTPRLTRKQRGALLLGGFLLRVGKANYMAPVAQITSGRGERIPILKKEVTFTAGRTGELFLYVNDSIRPFDWARYYRNNAGTASVVVTRVWTSD